MTLLDVRILFDGVVEKSPQLVEFLGSGAKIVKHAEFENAVVNTLSGLVLQEDEKQLLAKFRKEAVSGQTSDTKNSFADLLLKKCRSESKEFDCSWIPPTSNICKRSFSIAKYVRNQQRNRLLPLHVEV